jgi:ligand-binding sensor domain-containing protein/serine phosphatase RsbU (regulator of sigma subunit)
LRIFLNIKLFLSILSAVLYNCCSAQNYLFKNFGVDEGISHPFVYDINQDKNGYLWVSTGEGLCKFDGTSFKTYFIKNGITENFVGKSFRDNKQRLWFGHKQGGITLLENDSLKEVKTRGILTSLINDFAQDKDGSIWALSQNSGIAKITKDNKVIPYKTTFSSYLLYSLSITPFNQMLVGTNDGLKVIEIKNGKLNGSVQDVSEIPFTSITCIKKSKLKIDLYWIATEDAGLYSLRIDKNNKISVEQVNASSNFQNYKIQDVTESSNGDLWISTFGNGLLQLSNYLAEEAFEKVTNYNLENGLNNQNISSTFQDREDNIWIGKFGGSDSKGGISKLVTGSFLSYNVPDHIKDKSVTSIFMYKNIKYFGLNGTIMIVENNNFDLPVFLDDSNNLPADKITAIASQSDGTLWIGSESNGLYYLDEGSEKFIKYEIAKDNLSNSINKIQCGTENIWVATKNGLFDVDLKTNKTTLYDTETGLYHNSLNDIFLDKEEQLWFATNSAYLSYVKNGNVTNLLLDENNTSLLELVSIVEGLNGDKWIATYGSGVYHLDAKKIIKYTVGDGLKSNFCSSICVDANNNIWVGHNNGLSKIITSTNQIRIYDQKQNVQNEFNRNSIFIDSEKQIWFGTDNKILMYDPKKDIKNSVPPIINLEKIWINDNLISLKSEIYLAYGQYKIKFEFLGINLKNSDLVSYQYYLEGVDKDWNKLSINNFANYPNIEDGNYIFKVKAFNSDGTESTEVKEIKINISKPFWKKWWFALLLFATISLSILQIIRYRDKKQRELSDYLKKTLDERTKEVQIKSAELQEKNTNITSSINYAKKIQEATLPSINELKQYFSDSFIFYRPRDIVSGDFYWFRKFNNKFILVVADCTGHGVPGALMSMIASTMLNEIAADSAINSPNQALEGLDLRIKKVLNQRDNNSSPQDGMDITICEFDLDSMLLRTSSAMGEVCLIRNNKMEVVKGDRNPIGGSYEGTKKIFTLHELQLQKNDIIYLFTDGYRDQFGGEQKKKLKRDAFYKTILEASKHELKNQENFYYNHFSGWKGKHEQIDDVLVLGVKI